MRSVHGSDVRDPAQVQLLALELAAGAICIGGAPKLYGRSSCIEDSLLIAEGSHGVLAAVADGHNGPEASRLAIDWLAENRALDWTTNYRTAAAWEEEALLCFNAVDERIASFSGREGDSPRTTLVLGLVHPATGQAFLASAGDSHVYLASCSGVAELAVAPGAGRFFLGDGARSLSSLAGECAFCSAMVDADEVLLLASDGVSTPGIGFAEPTAAIHRVVCRVLKPTPADLPLRLAAGVAEAARRIQGHNRSGDHISVAVASRLGRMECQ